MCQVPFQALYKHFLSLRNNLRDSYEYYPYFTDEENKAQTVDVTC